MDTQFRGILDKIQLLPDLRKGPRSSIDDMPMSIKWPADAKPLRGDARTVCGLDVLLILLRHIADILEYSQAIDTSRNPILELAWRDIEGDKAEHMALKKEVIEAFQSHDGLQGPSFADLCESPLMRETWWGDSMFLLCGPPELAVGEDECVPDPLPDDSGFLAWRSLIGWDGASGLGDYLDMTWASREFEAGFVRRLTQTANMPSILRVLYNPPAECARQEKDLLTFEWDGPQKYTLVAAVWLRDGATDTGPDLDHIQLYDTNAADIAPLRRNMCSAASPENLGRPGSSYMLFYGACQEFDPYLARCLRDEATQQFLRDSENDVPSRSDWIIPRYGGKFSGCIPSVWLEEKD
ncbi:LOW QUALITY PROTEIN: hypothetical protein ColTof4_05863 [Colletotrichum tofieldiae]|nr:LOW QUALITY PROTEIN: hypothetical protein ColTof3_01036 [Colletotrichum tofieldiae]GKT73440.1 LOW QUALITY PROTEIN: hypothetical protein ColTof4_05863 [Colletotrichum tofieldiae]